MVNKRFLLGIILRDTCITDLKVIIIKCSSVLPVCALFASCLQDLIQLLHHHGDVDLCALGKHLGLFLTD